jgi:hypothetical protein
MDKISGILTQHNNSTSPALFAEARKSSVFFKPHIQPKLSINHPNDVYEQEADTVAEQVMQWDTPLQHKSFFAPSLIQKKCADCEVEEKKAQRKKSSDKMGRGSSETENYLSSLSDGKKLSNDERAFFEAQMGYDFSNVRIHNDGHANQSAKSISALAYTHGNDIVFGSDQYQPNTDKGKKLMAHELTHVVQQQSAAMIQRKPKFGADCEPFHQCQVEEGIIVGRQYVDAAIKSLTPVADGSLASGKEVDKLNYHFKTAALADVKLIIENYGLIKNELDAELLYVCYKDNPDDCKAEGGGAVGAFTFCSANRDVHICSFYYVCGCDERGRMIVHELAHHLGLCTDYAYRDEAGYAALTKDKAMKNADSYATLASDLFTGSRNCIGTECLKNKLKGK